MAELLERFKDDLYNKRLNNIDKYILNIGINHPEYLNIPADRDNNTLVHLAARNSFSNLASNAYFYSPSAGNSKNNSGHTALHETVMSNDDETSLLTSVFLGSKQTAADIEDDHGKTPLHYACENGNKFATEELLKKGASWDKFSKEGNLPIHEAAKAGNKDIMNTLLQNSYVPDISTEKEKDTPLHVAAKHGNIDTITSLCYNGADKDLTNKAGETPLISAIRHNQIDTSFALLNEGAKVNTTQPILHEAVKNGNNKLIDSLIDKVESIDMQDNNLNTPMHIAASQGKTNAIKKLAKKEANLEEENIYKDRPLHNAVLSGQEKATKQLIKHGCNLNASNNMDGTALHIAAAEGNQSISDMLIKNGADVNAKKSYSNITPLHNAVESGNVNLVDSLIINNADINAADKDGNTALHKAVEAGREDIVEELKNSGAKLDTKNNNKLTASDIAFNNSNLDLAEKANTPANSLKKAWTQSRQSLSYCLDRGRDAASKLSNMVSKTYKSISSSLRSAKTQEASKDKTNKAKGKSEPGISKSLDKGSPEKRQDGGIV